MRPSDTFCYFVFRTPSSSQSDYCDSVFVVSFSFCRRVARYWLEVYYWGFPAFELDDYEKGHVKTQSPLYLFLTHSNRPKHSVKLRSYRLNALIHFKEKWQEERTWSYNQVCELTTECLLWQHWTKALLQFDDGDISAFHSCVFIDIWHLFLGGIYYCLHVFWCTAARMSQLELQQRINIKFLVVS